MKHPQYRGEQAGNSTGKRELLLDRAFRIGVILKGLDGLFEVIGGILLLTVAPSTLNHLARLLTQHELSEDPHDFVAVHLLQLSANLKQSRSFGAFYLISHGAVKIVLVVGLLRNQRWAYPAALVFLGAFIAYQLYRLTQGLSIGLLLLTVFDLFVVWLVWREYRSECRPVAES